MFSRRGLFLPRSAGARWLNRGRFAAAGLCLLLAVVAALGAARPRPQAPAHLVPVVVAARTLPAGHPLGSRDLTVRRWPVELRPSGAFSTPRQLLERRLAAPLQHGEPVTAVRLLGHDLAAGLERGTVAVPISLPSAGAAIVRAGDYIDVLATEVVGDGLGPAASTGSGVPAPDGPEIVVRHALVLAALPGSGDAATGAPTTETVLALNRRAAMRIAALNGTRVFTAMLDPP